MDRDRSVVDGRDIFESRLQELVRYAFQAGFEYSDDELPDPKIAFCAELEEAYKELDRKVHIFALSYYDRPASDVGAQDETSQA